MSDNTEDWFPKNDDDFVSSQLISYIGNKRKLVDFIESAVIDLKANLGKDKISFFDGFSGSGVVSRAMRKHTSLLIGNDMETYSHIIGKCYLSNQSEVPIALLEEKIAYLNLNRNTTRFGEGIIEKLYAPKDDNNIQLGERVFYTNKNAKIIDNMRRMIGEFEPELFPYLIAPLLHEASVHTNTSGVFKGFYKNSTTGIGQFGGNARNCLNRIEAEIMLTLPIFSKYECEYKMHQADTNELIKELPEVDIAYYDPPYNQHPYGSNYFMLNVIADYIEPTEVSNVSGIPVDWNKSAYNKKKEATEAFNGLISNTRAKYILISYSTEGIMSVDELTDIFKNYGKVSILTKPYPVFRGSRNLSGRGKTLDELIFVIEK